MEKTPNDPIAAEVRFIPETGSKRPYEVWLRSARGAWYQRGSFATQKAADRKADCVAAIFGFTR